jgi:hypothetical protein
MIDLYGGSVELYFKTSDGQVMSLSDLFYPGSTYDSKFRSAHFINSVSVKLSLLKFLEITVNLNPTFDKAVSLLQLKNSPIGMGFGGSLPSSDQSTKSPDLAAEALSKINFNTMNLQIHYGGRSSAFFKAILLVPEINISEEGITIKLSGVGMLFERGDKSFNKAVTQSKRMDLIQSYVGTDARIITHADDSHLAAALEKTETMVSSGTHLAELKKILLKSNAYLHEFPTQSKDDPPTYELVSKNYMSTRDGSGITLVLWGQINPNEGRYPILDMQTSLVNYMNGQMLKQVFAYDRSKKEKSEASSNPETIPPKTNQELVSRNKTGVGANLEGNDQYHNVTLPHRGASFGTSVVETFEGIFNQFTDKALTYEITTVGIVDLKPGIPIHVEVSGVKILSGKYDLLEVTHDFGADGVTTKLSLATTFGIVPLISKGVDAVQDKVSPNETKNPSSSNQKASTTSGVIS